MVALAVPVLGGSVGTPGVYPDGGEVVADNEAPYPAGGAYVEVAGRAVAGIADRGGATVGAELAAGEGLSMDGSSAGVSPKRTVVGVNGGTAGSGPGINDGVDPAGADSAGGAKVGGGELGVIGNGAV